MDSLIDALKSTGKSVCLDAAHRLENARADIFCFDLHLRGADLVAKDATALAAAIRGISTASGPILRSFSASYNPEMTDDGIAALADAFPVTMTELGLVKCVIGDKGGHAILQWVKRADNPRMICVEENEFSSTFKSDFKMLDQQRPSMMLVI